MPWVWSLGSIPARSTQVAGRPFYFADLETTPLWLGVISHFCIWKKNARNTRPPGSRPQRASSRDDVERRPRHRLELAGLGDLVDVEPGVEEHPPPAEVVGRLAH